MDQQNWKNIFSIQAMILNQKDSWKLEFDDKLVPDCPDPGWQQYIRNTGGRFQCSECGRGWPSNRVMVIFHMHLISEQGTVRVRCMRQNCKICLDAPMEDPSIPSENIKILLENLVKKIRIKCYHERLDDGSRPPVQLVVNSPHEPDHCEGCLQGICNRS